MCSTNVRPCRAWRKVDQEHYRFQDALKLRREALKEELQDISTAFNVYKEVVDATELVGGCWGVCCCSCLHPFCVYVHVRLRRYVGC